MPSRPSGAASARGAIGSRLLLPSLLAGYLATGFYVVNADEHAVVRRFGAVERARRPGMHYRAAVAGGSRRRA